MADMPTAILLPDLATDDDPVWVTAWLVDVGDVVDEGDRVVEVLTRGITFDVSAPMSGVLTRIARPIDAVVSAGDVLGWIAAYPDDESDGESGPSEELI